MVEPINTVKNKIEESGLITINLEDYYHNGERILFDIKPYLYKELVLKESDFRKFIKEHEWQQYAGKNIAFACSADAIVPTWAYMLLAIAIKPYANRFVFGNLQTLDDILYYDAINTIDINALKDKRVIVKGCSNFPVPTFAYTEITNKLLPVVKSLMYGEACSNVPLYKKK